MAAKVAVVNLFHWIAKEIGRMDSIAIATWGLVAVTAILVYASFKGLSTQKELQALDKAARDRERAADGQARDAEREADRKAHEQERMQELEDRQAERLAHSMDQGNTLRIMQASAEATRDLAAETAHYTQVTRMLAEEAERQTRESARLVSEMEAARYAEKLPVLYPQGAWFLDPKQILPEVDWYIRDAQARIENLGSGPALDVLGVIMSPDPEDHSPNLMYRLWGHDGVAAGSTIEIPLQRSGLMVDATTKVRGQPLGPPSPASQSDVWWGRAPTYHARLTLTYKDVFERKHAMIFDLTSEKVWKLVAFEQDVSMDLAELDRAARPEAPIPDGNFQFFTHPRLAGPITTNQVPIVAADEGK